MIFLIDECLTPDLAVLARNRGYHASHVAHQGLSGKKDWEIRDIAVAGDLTLVTCNSVDFRGSASNPGTRGEYANVQLHAGLICLNGPIDGTNIRIQKKLFEIALDDIESNGDLINKLLDIFMDDYGDITIRRHPLPP